MITDHFWKLNWKIYRSNLQIDYQSGQSNKRTPIELAPSDCRLGFGGREAFCLVATWWRIFVYHSWKASRPVYIFDRVEERPSKLPSNFGRLANRCLNIHGGILMRLLHTWNISYRYSNWLELPGEIEFQYSMKSMIVERSVAIQYTWDRLSPARSTGDDHFPKRSNNDAWQVLESRS